MKKKISQRKILILLSAIALIVLWGRADSFEKVRSIVWSSADGILRPLYGLGGHLRDFREVFLSPQRSTERLAALREENHRLRALAAEAERLRVENERLRTQLNLPEKTVLQSFWSLGADVVAANVGDKKEWLVINRGRVDGLRSGQAVVTEGSVLVGSIVEVFDKTARVRLLTHPQSNVRVSTVRAGTTGIVSGQAGLGLLMKMVDPTESLADGDKLFTVAQSVFPPELFVGTVRDVRLSADGLFQEASVSLPYEVSRLRTVTVLIE